MVYLLPPDGMPQGNTILPTDKMCKATQESSEQQTPGYPRLQASAGGMIALRYQENGHTTKLNPSNKPDNRGTVYIYGTTQSSPTDNFLDIHKVWNTAGTGGNKKGKLIATQNFDDGRCYQENNSNISGQRNATFVHTNEEPMGPDLWCQNDIVLPTDVSTDELYTLYWVWDWPTEVGAPGAPNGKTEIYTTCMDVDIVPAAAGADKQVSADSYAEGQSLNSAAVPAYFSAALAGSSILVATATQASAAATSATSNAARAETTPASVLSSQSPGSPAAAPASTPSESATAPMVTVYPVATIMSTVTVLPVVSTPTMPPTTTSSMPSMVTSIEAASDAPGSSIPAVSASSCAATQKRSKIFASGAPQKRSPKPNFSMRGSAKFRNF